MSADFWRSGDGWPQARRVTDTFSRTDAPRRCVRASRRPIDRPRLPAAAASFVRPCPSAARLAVALTKCRDAGGKTTPDDAPQRRRGNGRAFRRQALRNSRRSTNRDRVQ